LHTYNSNKHIVVVCSQRLAPQAHANTHHKDNPGQHKQDDSGVEKCNTIASHWDGKVRHFRTTSKDQYNAKLITTITTTTTITTINERQ
jgi:hypothetical protein